MRMLSGTILIIALASMAAGCGSRKSYDGPTVDAFTGRLTHNGQPVSFATGEKVQVEVFHEKGQKFGIPIQPDGSFQIGWMPIGKYSMLLVRQNNQERGAERRYNIPGKLAIEQGKTEYTIELGKDWKP
jgi:hypothetical protein